MPPATPPHPKIVSPQKWLNARIKHLGHEKDLTKHHDRVAAQRRRLPMVKVEKDYGFEARGGKQRLLDLFEGRRQLIVYHFMFDPKWKSGCPGCTGYVDALGDLSMLEDRNTTFVLVSRAPLKKLEIYKKRRGWNKTWVSSFGSDFNYDFHVTLDEKVMPVVYNYRSKAEMIAKKVPNPTEGEEHGMSVFFRIGDDVYHNGIVDRCVRPAGADAIWAPGGLGRFTVRLAAKAHVRLKSAYSFGVWIAWISG
jgi:predicted dithiol-disulfide oxidoreductase (DUF899 family)